ncbi:MAG: bacteriohemerythrin [Gallionella sp.]|nr:bacteriohemerythrin [Gallionella sp.]
MPRIDWNEKFSLSIREIDDQHKRWIGIMNELHDALMNGEGPDTFEKTLESLSEYTHYHFAHEEAFMKKINYEAFHDHRRLHDAFKNEIFSLQNEFLSGNVILHSQVMSRLQNWLRDHILIEDRKFADFYHHSD